MLEQFRSLSDCMVILSRIQFHKRLMECIDGCPLQIRLIGKRHELAICKFDNGNHNAQIPKRRVRLRQRQIAHGRRLKTWMGP